jgi:hypothetical protein
MTDDLVERVARALCEAKNDNWLARNFNETGDGTDPEENREYYRSLANIAIAIALEEAAKVVTAETDEYPIDDFDRGVNCGIRNAAAAIRAMITEMRNIRNIETNGQPEG